VTASTVPSEAEDLSALLAHWDVGIPVSVEPVTRRGHLLKLAFASRPSLVLKDTGLSAERAKWNYRFHAKVLAHLDAGGVGVPLPVQARSGEPFVDWRDRRYTLSRFQEDGRRPTGPGERRLLYRNVGASIARFHQGLATYPREELERETQPEDITRRSLEWTEELLAKVAPEQRRALATATDDLMPRVHESLGGMQHQLIHRDLHPGNMLTAGTEAVGFIDCDHFCTGPRLLDLAYYALSLRKWADTHGAEVDHWTDYLRALIDGYDSISEVTNHERVAIPYLMAAIEVRLAVWLFDLQPATVARETEVLDWLRLHLPELEAATRRCRPSAALTNRV
jgi:Ser/Thr protein kinase RdoA (MazF antagonist)